MDYAAPLLLKGAHDDVQIVLLQEEGEAEGGAMAAAGEATAADA